MYLNYIQSHRIYCNELIIIYITYTQCVVLVWQMAPCKPYESFNFTQLEVQGICLKVKGKKLHVSLLSIEILEDVFAMKSSSLYSILSRCQVYNLDSMLPSGP